MPDMKSEILKVKETMQSLDNLDFDDDDPNDNDVEKLELTNANLQRWVAENPGKSCAEMRRYFKKSSQLSTRLSQGVKNGFLMAKQYQGANIYFRTDKQVMTVEERTANLQMALRKFQGDRRAGKIPTKPKSKAHPEKAARKPRQPAAPTVTTEWDVDVFINNVGLKQAKTLYEKLREYFG